MYVGIFIIRRRFVSKLLTTLLRFCLRTAAALLLLSLFLIPIRQTRQNEHKQKYGDD